MKILLLTLLLMAPSAHADVLFLDLNNSPHEVAAAREAAKKSKREFHLVPNTTAADQKELARLKGQANSFARAYGKKCKDPKAPGCEELRKKEGEAYAAHQAKVKSFEFSPEMLENFLAERESKNKPVTSVVVSGHDGTGTFSGEFGHVGDQQLAEIFEKYPQSKDAIRALHLWGCYTTSPGSLLLNWKKHFPNTSIITGYEGRAPLNDKPAGWHYLKGVLAQEEQLFAAQDHAKLKKLLNRIPGANMVLAAVNVCDEYASYKESYNLKDLDERCKNLKVELEKNLPEYQCFLRANEDKCKDPPTNVGAGAVRAFYEILHKSAACTQISRDEIYRTVSRDQAIRLVFAKEVQKNFHNIYRTQIAESDLFLDSLGAPPELRFTGLEKLSRQDLMRRAEALRAFVEARSPDPTQDPGTAKFGTNDAKIIALNGLQRALTDTMMNLSPDCVPFNWTEPNMTEKSKCIHPQQLGTSSLEGYLSDSAKIDQDRFQKMKSDLNARITAASQKIESDKVAESERLVWLAMMNRIDAYLYKKEGSVNSKKLEKANAQIQWAESMLNSAKAGALDPARDSATITFARRYNLLALNGFVDDTEKELQHYREQLAKNNDESQVKRLQEKLSYHEKILNRNKLTQEILKRELMGESTTNESFRQMKAELKEILWKEKEDNEISAIKSIQSYLRTLRDVTPRSTLVENRISQFEKAESKHEAELIRLREKKDSVAEELLFEATDLPEHYVSELAYRKKIKVVQAAGAGSTSNSGVGVNPFGAGAGMFGTVPLPPSRPDDGSNVRPDNPDENSPQSQLERESPGEDLP
jgi:hypothetical protein